MMRRTFGAPLGGTTVGGQYGLESLASMLITPPKGGGGGGMYFPSIVVVAPGEPGTFVTSCACAIPASITTPIAQAANVRCFISCFMWSPWLQWPANNGLIDTVVKTP